MSDLRFSLRARLGRLMLEVELQSGDQPIAIIGPNGSGKSTLLRLLCGALTPESGFIEVGGRLFFDHSKGIDLPPETRRVGYVPQGSGLFPHLDVLDNVAFSSRFGERHTARTPAREAARDFLNQLGCGALIDRPTRSLSGGERQRVALARALNMDPALLLFDEPLSALDPGARRRSRLFLAKLLRDSGHPALVVTHDVRDVLGLEASVLVMERGHVVQRGSLRELKEHPVNEFVAEFVSTY